MFETMHAFFSQLIRNGIVLTASVSPVTAAYRSNFNPHRIVSPVPEIRSDGLHVFNLGTELVCRNLHEQSRSAFLIGLVVLEMHCSCLRASKPLYAAFLTTFRAPFCMSSVSKYSKVADCCSCGGVAVTVGDCLISMYL